MGFAGLLMASVKTSNITVSVNGANLKAVAAITPNAGIANGVWGFKWSFSDSTLTDANGDTWWVDEAGSAGAQSISVPFTDLNGYTGAGQTLYAQAGYSLSNPATTIVYVGSITTLTSP